MLSLDLHTHTRFFHGRDRLAERFDPYGHAALAAVARRRGLDGVALTNHDYYRPLGSPSKGFLSVPGIEISTTKGHVLVVGSDPPTRTKKGAITPAEAVELAHDRGCVAIIAHPFRNSTIRETDVEFDAIECNGKHPRTWPLVREIANERGIPLVGGSDAHYPVEVGRAYTKIDAEPTPEAIVGAIRAGRVEPAVAGGTLARLLRRGYKRIHKRKGHLPLDPTPGVGAPPED
ncbi:PHP-associated domain-containing protein [Halalkalicoccus jeotgali]|uniref:PHP domain protein n=1 Tax=Halalkalicoccus jeotgali (strain DSM 18796 / CECT 7217 / JCM 14584 / KCTC 4019 / B3) TaxID=795797 RepID=D8JAC5_HALJB|nr:PHP-associated domain-containing protein [Halalkalicoccus jeotgali]ADJ14647.1 PHP domain protein [Halalkalicoccus jeotgali B3]ELY39545.1 PHP domain-containing protein [Halalkalicoccus jeotgali B3]